MNAAWRTHYGPPEVLEVRDIPKPTPKAEELLIRVQAATVNRTDCAILTARPAVMRLITGLFRPRLSVTGTDFAGVVEAIGNNVTQFKIGDELFGFDDSGLSSHAEYLTISQKKAMLPIPQGFSFVQAAASAEAAHYAYHFIHKLKISSGMEALVIGGTGAIGSALVQFLKYHELKVTAVCGTQHLETVRALGVDRVVDYQKEDFTRDEQRYDFVFDAVGKSAFDQCKPLLNENGIYQSSELGPGGENLYLPLLTKIQGGKKVIFPFPSDIRASLQYVSELVEKQRFAPLIDRTFPLDSIQEAYAYVASGQKIGNVLLGLE